MWKDLEKKYGVKKGIYALFFKRFIDLVVTLVGFIFISPIFLILCILVRTKLGSPIFFKQKRTGKDEKIFEMIKFRTMTDARDENGELLPDTERFTKFGDFMRNYSLDELPELLNVIKGDMSLIGPRPLYPFYVPYYTEEESLRHSVRGGITGLAQVNGRALCRWNDRFAYDVKYVKNITFVGDIKVLLQTVMKVLGKADIGVPSVTDEGGLHIVREVQRPDRLYGEFLKKMSTHIEHENKEIGSYFSIDPDVLNVPCKTDRVFLNCDNDLYSTCRSAIQSILRTIESGSETALLPAFTCHAVVEPFLKSGFEVYPYQINKDFTIDVESLRLAITDKRPSVILVHDYFGFNTNESTTTRNLLRECQENGVVIIEDLTQSMFSAYDHIVSDYQVGSIRKWMGIPDGAFLRGSGVESPKEQDKPLEEAKKKAMVYKHEYLTKQVGEKTELLELYRKAENILDSQEKAYTISSLSKQLLNSYDVSEFCNDRRKNARVLVDKLSQLETVVLPFSTVAEKETPFYVPVMVAKERKELQQYLARNGVFATVIWGCPEEFINLISYDTKAIYEQILCVPCDQRYTENDMKFIGELFAGFIEDKEQLSL